MKVNDKGNPAGRTKSDVTSLPKTLISFFDSFCVFMAQSEIYDQCEKEIEKDICSKDLIFMT